MTCDRHLHCFVHLVTIFAQPVKFRDDYLNAVVKPPAVQEIEFLVLPNSLVQQFLPRPRQWRVREFTPGKIVVPFCHISSRITATITEPETVYKFHVQTGLRVHRIVKLRCVPRKRLLQLSSVRSKYFYHSRIQLVNANGSSS